MSKHELLQSIVGDLRERLSLLASAAAEATQAATEPRNKTDTPIMAPYTFMTATSMGLRWATLALLHVGRSRPGWPGLGRPHRSV